MDREPWSSLYDRELDHLARLHRHDPLREPFEPYRRLLVNPLLGVAVGVGSYGVMQIAVQAGHLTLFLAALVGLLSSVLFTQFHCLDCGRSIWLWDRDRHACEPSLARWREGRRSRWPFPATRAQILLWLYVGVAVFWLTMIARMSNR